MTIPCINKASSETISRILQPHYIDVARKPTLYNYATTLTGQRLDRDEPKSG